jgi:pimeloyl-ACP methyl ester carboxylesterase
MESLKTTAMQHRYLTLNGIKHHLCTWGNPKKPKLFFFHGWMDMGASFDFVCHYLQKDYHCIAMDWRGFGKSAHTKNPAGYFFYEYLADVQILFHKLTKPEETVKVVAHSMGGNILAFYAGCTPNKISHFINIEGFGIQDMAPEKGPKRMREWLDRFLTPNRFQIYKNLFEVAQRLRKTNPRLPEKRALILAKHLAKKVRGGFQVAADPRHKQPGPYLHQLANVYPFWENVTAKCLLLIAENTEMSSWMTYIDNIQAEINRRLDHFPPSAQRVLIKDCGHMVHHEKPEELAKLVRNFLNLP